MAKKILFLPIIILLIIIIHDPIRSYADETVCFSKTKEIMFKSQSLENGLSNGTVYTIGQDSRGAMWFGTDDKLNMYDGISFTHFENDPESTNSIVSNSASNIYVDREDNIWIGTWGAGLDMYDYTQKQFTHYKNDINDLSSLSDNRVQTVFQDSSGTIWVGTFAGGLNKLNETTGKFERYMNSQENPNSISNNRIWGMCEVDDGNLVIATSDGLNYFDVKKGTFESYKNNPEQSTTIASSGTRVLYKVNNGEIWVGTGNGISLFDTKNRTFQNYQLDMSKFNLSLSTVNALLLDNKGSLWVGGYEGLLQFDTKKKRFVNHYSYAENDLSSLALNHINTLYQDRSGLIWVGTRGGGVSTFNPNITFSYLENNRGDVGIQPLMLDKAGNMWIANNDGLFKYTPSNGQTQLILDGKINPVPGILCEDSQGNIWAGSTNGLIFKYEHSTYISKELEVPYVDEQVVIKEMLADGDDLWISTYRGSLYLMDMKSETLKSVYVHDINDPSSISGNEIESIYKDSKGRLWFGTENGVSLLNRDTQTFTTYNINFVYAIHEDSNGRLWLGSREGLYSIKLDVGTDLNNDTLEIKNYDQKDGLANNMVYCIQEDDKGNIWVGTEYGISKFDQIHSRFINYNKKNGLKFDKFNPGFSTKSKGGEIYFGGNYRTVSFFPENMEENTTVPNVILTNIEVNGKPLEFDQSIDQIETINLTYRDILFSFEFSALDFFDSRGNQYAYMLEGFDSDWNYGKNRTYVSYTNINPGRYTFRVKASNSDGYWNEEGVGIKIVITPSWWDCMTFKVTALIAMIISLFSVYYIRTTSLKRQNAILEKKVDERTWELATLNAELSKLASIDDLTQLTNRRYADHRMKTEWKRAQRDQTELSVIMLDIDYFKEYNDLYGHPQGDECLKLIADLLDRIAKRTSNMACRYGGEEFLLIVPNTPLEGAFAIAETLQKELRALEIPHEKSKVSEFVTCSIGIAVVIPQNELNVANLIQIADNALYKAKRQGRNQIIVGDMI